MATFLRAFWGSHSNSSAIYTQLLWIHLDEPSLENRVSIKTYLFTQLKTSAHLLEGILKSRHIADRLIYPKFMFRVIKYLFEVGHCLSGQFIK